MTATLDSLRLVKDAPADGGPFVVQVDNPSPYRRRETVVWCDSVPYWPWRVLPRSYWNVGTIDVPGGWHGQVAVEPQEESAAFDLHPAVLAGLEGWQPWIEVNGNPVAFRPSRTHDAAVPQLIVHTWHARCAEGVAELVVYVRRRQPVIYAELVFHCESLQTPSRPIALRLQCQHGGGPEGMKLVGIDGCNPDALLTLPEMWDGQGSPRYQLAFVFWSADMLADRAAGQPRREDTLAAMSAPWGPLRPLSTTVATWGPWDAPLDPVRTSAALGMTTYLAQLGRWSTLAPMEQNLAVELIGSYTPADSGAQGGWGTWKVFRGLAARDARALRHELANVAKEECRPACHWWEPDGSPVTAAAHPRFVALDEQRHYHLGVSPDQLGRQYVATANVWKWRGYDRQHHARLAEIEVGLLACSVSILHAYERWAEMFLAGMTIPSQRPNYATNDPEGGRAQRIILAACSAWRLTGDNRLVDRAFDFFRLNVLAHPTSGYVAQPERQDVGDVPFIPWTMFNDPRQIAGKLAWIPWQDGCGAGCLDALRVILELQGRDSDAQLVADFVCMLGGTVAAYGFLDGPTAAGGGIVGALAPDFATKDPAQVFDYDPAHGRAKYYEPGGRYRLWAFPGVVAARRVADRRITKGPGNRSNPDPLTAAQYQAIRDRCDKVLAWLRPIVAREAPEFLGCEGF